MLVTVQDHVVALGDGALVDRAAQQHVASKLLAPHGRVRARPDLDREHDVDAFLDLFLETIVEVIEHLLDEFLVVELRQDDIVFVGHGAFPEIHRRVARAREDDAHVVGLSILSGSHVPLVATLMDEMRAGAQGCCPGADLVDVYGRVYDLYQDGQEAQAQALFDGLAPMRELKLDAHWLLLMKERLRRRGVFSSTRSRVAPYELRWKSDADQAAFEAAYAAIEPLFDL